MKFSFCINLFLAQCLSVHALDQNIPLSDEYQRRVQDVVSDISVGMPVSYECLFINRWTSVRHPNNFPTPNEVWSRPLMASHNNEYTMWSADQVPSEGVQRIAERGSSRPLVGELKTAENVNSFVQGNNFNPMGDMDSTVLLGQLEEDTGHTSQLEMDTDHRLISTISKITPSPDWFSGLNSYSPVKDDMWLSSFTVESFPWDAGSEDGTEYNGINDATEPLMKSSRFTDTDPGVFLNTDEDVVLPVAQWSCRFTPTATPTAATPTATPTATDVPTTPVDDRPVPCADSATATFFRANNRGPVPANLPRDCAWLADQVPIIQFRHCRRGRVYGPQPMDPTTLLAKVACPKTCDTCPT